MNKEKFDKWFLRYYWKIIVTFGYITYLIIFSILHIYNYGVGISEFIFLNVFYVALTWQIFIERGD